MEAGRWVCTCARYMVLSTFVCMLDIFRNKRLVCFFRQKLRVEAGRVWVLSSGFSGGGGVPRFILWLSCWVGVDWARGLGQHLPHWIEYSRAVLDWFTPCFMNTPLPNPPLCLLQGLRHHFLRVVFPDCRASVGSVGTMSDLSTPVPLWTNPILFSYLSSSPACVILVDKY